MRAVRLTALFAVLAALAGAPSKAGTPPQAAPAGETLSEIRVTADRTAAADERVRRSVESALAADPYFYSEHVTITVANGVATLHGIVFDDWDLRQAMRIARHIPGIRRVVNDLEIQVGGD